MLLIPFTLHADVMNDDSQVEFVSLYSFILRLGYRRIPFRVVANGILNASDRRRKILEISNPDELLKSELHAS
jgi:hypothetical protein